MTDSPARPAALALVPAAALLATALAPPARATTLTVGPGEQYATVSAAVAASRDGDVVAVRAGTYPNDYPVVTHKITIAGVGGLAHLASTGPIPNGEGIILAETDVTIRHLELSGAVVADGNGAGIRYEGGNLVLQRSYVHDNQDGILGNAVAGGTVRVGHSEFADNGACDG